MTGTDDDRASAGELFDIADIRGLLGVGKARAYTISRDRAFPAPWLDHPQLRLWRKRDVRSWVARWRPELVADLDTRRPGWRDDRPPPQE